jgi:hypothetical protein
MQQQTLTDTDAALAEEMLTVAYELVRIGWCQGAGARDEAGRPVAPASAFARSWSAPGALERVWARSDQRFAVELDAFQRANLALATAIGDTPQFWNDANGRTLREVLDALAQAVHLVAGPPDDSGPPGADSTRV